MNRALKILPVFLLLAIAGSAQDQNAVSWQNDLDYLVKRIEIMHPQPYAFIPQEEFYKLKDRLFNEIPSLSDAAIVISISELLASLQDGHTRMGFENSNFAWLGANFHLLPFILYPFDDGVYILAGLPKFRDLVGLKVEKLGELPVAEAMVKLGRLFSHDNAQGRKKSLYYTLGFAEMLKKIGAVDGVDRISLSLRTAKNKLLKVGIDTVPFTDMARFLGSWYPQSCPELATMNEGSNNPRPLWLTNNEKKFWFATIPEEKLMFLQINSLLSPHGEGEGSFAQLCAQFFAAFDLARPAKLVIDIRANNGGNHVELPLLKGILARPDIDRPDRLFLITGRVTYSAAVHFTTIFKKYTQATIIGEPTAGRPNHYGAYRPFKLPNHPQITIGCSVDYYQDSEPFDFTTTHTPDILTAVTSADYRNNIDPAIKKVLEYDRIRDLVRGIALELGKEYMANGGAGLKKSYLARKQELLNSGYNPEKFFNDFINDWFFVNKKSMSDYIELLAFVCSECPESIDFLYALAVRTEAQGRVADAVKYYEQCLQLNPTCHYAKMKLGLLELANMRQ
jgi:predicted metal-binding protein